MASAGHIMCVYFAKDQISLIGKKKKLNDF